MVTFRALCVTVESERGYNAMRKITMFYMKTCPYCKEAKRFIEEITEEAPEYKMINIEYIDETVERRLAGKYDYYFVPAFFVGEEKLHEGAATLEKVRRVFEAAAK